VFAVVVDVAVESYPVACEHADLVPVVVAVLRAVAHASSTVAVTTDSVLDSSGQIIQTDAHCAMD
jgi:hypothetical protein